MKSLISAAAFGLLFSATPLMAQTCESNFEVEGTPMLTALNFVRRQMI